NNGPKGRSAQRNGDVVDTFAEERLGNRASRTEDRPRLLARAHWVRSIRRRSTRGRSTSRGLIGPARPRSAQVGAQERAGSGPSRWARARASRPPPGRNKYHCSYPYRPTATGSQKTTCSPGLMHRTGRSPLEPNEVL